MAVGTVDEYLSALEKSKLLVSEQFVRAQGLAKESSDAADFAKALAREKLVSRWQAVTLLAFGRRAQLHLGKYKLIQRLGKGGMGTVFLAEHVAMNRRVALKIVPRAVVQDRVALDHFFAEARAIAALDHPNIVRAYSVDNEMDRYFIVMEFVDGQDLQRLVETGGPMSFGSAAEFIRQAAEGLAHAHARNLVHCDIKPANLLVNSQGMIKILDLGLVRLKQSDETHGTASGAPTYGTVDYMAPEQALGTANFDHRADIYALGCTLYFLLTGHPPFPEGSLAQRIVKHQTQEPRDILAERPETPPELVEVCNRMMAKRPEERYQSSQEVITALAPWQDRGDGAAHPVAARSVRPLNDSDSGLPAADDFLSFLAESSATSAITSGPKPVFSAGPAMAGKSREQPRASNQPRGGIAATLVRVLNAARLRLGWFNTTKRRILGVIGGTALVSIVAGLASLPLLVHRPPGEQASLQPQVPEKKAAIDGNTGPSPGSTAGEKTGASPGPAEKGPPEAKAVGPKKSEQPKEGPTNSSVSPPPVKPMPDPGTKPNVPPPKTDTTPEKPAVDPPKTKPEPAKPPEQIPPFSLDGLVGAVDLPSSAKGANEAVSLGKLDLDPRQTLGIQILGGDTIAKGNPKFALQEQGEAKRAWAIQMIEKNKDSVDVARLWQAQNDWKLQWSAGVKDKALLVRYCALQFAGDKKTHRVTLNAPKIVPPMPIDFDTGMARARLSKDSPLPDLATIRLHVLPLDKAMPKYEIKILEPKPRGGRPVRGKPLELIAGDTVPLKGHVFVSLIRENTPRVYFDISLDSRGKELVLDMQAYYGQNLPLNWKSLKEVNAYVLAAEAAQTKNGRQQTPEQAQATKKAKEDLKAMQVLVGELSQKTSIPFRVFALLGQADDEASKSVIFQSGEMESPKAGATKKNPKGNKGKGRGSSDLGDLKL
jgi:serine/threonine protein kinase